MAQKTKKPKKINPKHHSSTFRPKHLPVRVAHHAHTGRRLPFYCTSYALIFFLLAFASFMIFYMANFAQAVERQESGSINLTGQIEGPPPEIAAKILNPKEGDRFTQSEIEVSGTCLQDTFIDLYRNTIYAGTAVCDSNGNFQLTITITSGANQLIAKTKDSLDQFGPDSEPVNVVLDMLVVAAGQSSARPTQQAAGLLPLQIYTAPIQRSGALGKSFEIEYQVHGDKPPYAISIDWGDGTLASLSSHDKDGTFMASHTMKQAGQKIVRISGLGAGGGKATIQTIVVVYGEGMPSPLVPSYTCTGTDCPGPTTLERAINLLWIPLIVAAMMAGSFWLGEKFMYLHLRAH